MQRGDDENADRQRNVRVRKPLQHRVLKQLGRAFVLGPDGGRGGRGASTAGSSVDTDCIEVTNVERIN